MTIEKICDGIAEKIGDKALFDAGSFARVILQTNDNNQIKAALALERIFRPEYLPEDFDPYQIDTTGYALICTTNDGDDLLFARYYPVLYLAQEEMRKQYEHCQVDDCPASKCYIYPDRAWISYDSNQIVDGCMSWSIWPINEIWNSIDGYKPIQ